MKNIFFNLCFILSLSFLIYLLTMTVRMLDTNEQFKRVFILFLVHGLL